MCLTSRTRFRTGWVEKLLSAGRKFTDSAFRRFQFYESWYRNKPKTEGKATQLLDDSTAPQTTLNIRISFLKYRVAQGELTVSRLTIDKTLLNVNK